MYRWCRCAAVVTALALAGCQPGPLDNAAYPQARPLGERLNAYRPPPPTETAATVQQEDVAPDPTGELTLRQAMALAVARNPKLKAFGWEVRRAESRALQAGLWPNPELEIEFENFGGSKQFEGTQSLETTVSLAQTFPLGGDIERRRDVARYATRLAGWDYEAARLEVLTDVTQRYVAVLAAERRVTVAGEALDLAREVQTTTGKRIEAGDAPPIEAARASVPVATAQVAVKRAERQLRAARKQLALTWASDSPTFDALAGSLDDIQPPPAADALVAYVNDSPAVARWATDISAHRAEAQLAEAEAVPDVTGRLGYKHDGADEAGALVVGISLPLPIFDRRQGDTLAARLGATAARQRQREAELRLESMLSESYARLANAYDEAVAIRDVALPPATESFEVTRRAFEKGDLTFIDVLDAERTLVDLRRQHLEALAEYHAAAAEIEGLIGRPLGQIGDGQTPDKPTESE